MKSKRSSIFLFVSLLLVGCTTFVTVYLLAQDPTSSLWGAGRKWTTAASANTSSAPSYAAGTSSSSVLDPSSVSSTNNLSSTAEKSIPGPGPGPGPGTPSSSAPASSSTSGTSTGTGIPSSSAPASSSTSGTSTGPGPGPGTGTPSSSAPASSSTSGTSTGTTATSTSLGSSSSSSSSSRSTEATFYTPTAQTATSASGADPTKKFESHKFAGAAASALKDPCAGTKNKWCQESLAQKPVPWKPAPRGDRSCPKDCNNMGNCNHATGMCECQAGFIGDDCTRVQKRPCTGELRNPSDPSNEPKSYMDVNGSDKAWTVGSSIYGRCAGVCDDDLAMCYCSGTYGRIPAPVGSPPGTPPIQRGRPMVTQHCQPSHTKTGQRTAMRGERPYDHIFGDKGWCMSDTPLIFCPCIMDGMGGRFCNETVEAFCVNQCSGHGFCNLGFCKCDPGWYGHDCSLKRAGLPMEPSTIPQSPWLDKVVAFPKAAMYPPPAETRKRPLIYIYDLEPMYSSRLLQYRIPSSWCVHRRYGDGNHSMFMDMWVYAVDTLFHELLAQSEHRTYDPEEADFFYVPQQSSCYPFPIMGWADYPWFADPGSDRRPNHMAVIIQETKDWIDKHHPFWKRRGGKDHIWLFLHDEGACWAPNDVVPSIWLTHWGRLELNHTSNSAFLPDNYSEDFMSIRQPEGWLKNIRGHVCYNPKKDLVIPSFKAPNHYRESPLLLAPEKRRDILLFFLGDVGRGRLKQYSRGVRQKMHNLSLHNNWTHKYNIIIGDRKDAQGDYSTFMSRAKYCLVMPGDGWSARAEDSMLHGCVPVVLMDEVHAVFESILDWSKFGLRFKSDDVDKILDTLLAIPEEQYKSLQENVAKVWHRFRYARGPALENDISKRIRDQADRAKVDADKEIQEHLALPDAFDTVMQWLYSRIDDTR